METDAEAFLCWEIFVRDLSWFRFNQAKTSVPATGDINVIAEQIDDRYLSMYNWNSEDFSESLLRKNKEAEQDECESKNQWAGGGRNTSLCNSRVLPGVLVEKDFMKKRHLLHCLVLLLCACTWNDLQVVFALPSETQIGSNTVGFLQNDNLWVNYGQVCHFLQPCLENSSATYFLFPVQ